MMFCAFVANGNVVTFKPRSCAYRFRDFMEICATVEVATRWLEKSFCDRYINLQLASNLS